MTRRPHEVPQPGIQGESGCSCDQGREDITDIPMARGFIYLAAVLDWFTRRVLAWRVSITLEADFCIEALEEVLTKYGAPEIFKTDSQKMIVSSRAA